MNHRMRSVFLPFVVAVFLPVLCFSQGEAPTQQFCASPASKNAVVLEHFVERFYIRQLINTALIEEQKAEAQIYNYSNFVFVRAILFGFVLSDQLVHVEKGSERQRIWNEIEAEIDKRLLCVNNYPSTDPEKERIRAAYQARVRERYRRALVGGYDAQLASQTAHARRNLPPPDLFADLIADLSQTDRMIIGNWYIPNNTADGRDLPNAGSKLLISFDEKKGRVFELELREKGGKLNPESGRGSWTFEIQQGGSIVRGVLQLSFAAKRDNQINKAQINLRLVGEPYLSVNTSGIIPTHMLTWQTNLLPGATWEKMDENRVDDR